MLLAATGIAAEFGTLIVRGLTQGNGDPDGETAFFNMATALLFNSDSPAGLRANNEFPKGTVYNKKEQQ